MRLVLTHHRRFRRPALEEAADVLGDLVEIERPDYSVTVVDHESPLPASALAATTFLQHVAPGHLSLKLTGGSVDVGALVAGTVEMASQVRRPFAVQCRRGAQSGGSSHAEASYSTRDVEIAIGRPIEERGVAVSLDRPEVVLSVYLGSGTAYAGLSPAADNKRALIPQHPDYTATPVVCRAEHKLVEAIEFWGLRNGLSGAAALDLGASPGGWSWVLAGAGAKVTAVDPGGLVPAVGDHPSVTHLRQRAETLDYEKPTFDWVVNDMNVDPPVSAAILLDAHRWLRDGARSITTLKLAGRSRPREALAAFVTRLSPHYELLDAQHLYSNRQEVTLLLRRS